MTDAYYIGYKLFINCPNCHTTPKIKKINLSIPLYCCCEGKEEIVHISEIYKQIQIKERFTFTGRIEYNNNLPLFIISILTIIRKIIYTYFSSYSNFFIFDKNEFSGKEYDENASEFFEENDIEKMDKNIKNLQNNEINEKIVQNLKKFLLDIFYFVLLLKKCPYFLDKLSFQDIYTNCGELDEESSKLYIQFQEELKIHFLPDYYYDTEKNKIYEVIPILEKNLFLLVFIDEIKFYDIQLKNIIFSVKAKISKAKIYKINCENFIVSKNIDHLDFEKEQRNLLHFMKIKYNAENKPIELYETELLENGIKSNIKYKIKEVGVIDDKNIICVDLNNKIYLLKRNENKKFYIYQEIKEIYVNNNSSLYFLSDKINEQVIIYRDTNLFFYDFNMNLKNRSGFNYIETVQILNKDVYLLKTFKNIILISSKYLEIICQYEIDHLYCKKIIMLRHSGNFLILPKRSEHHPLYFRIINNELKFFGQKCYDENIYIDAQEINENGDYFVFTNQNCFINKKKYYFPILYFNKKDKCFIDNLPNLNDDDKYCLGRKMSFNSDNYYIDDSTDEAPYYNYCGFIDCPICYPPPYIDLISDIIHKELKIDNYDLRVWSKKKKKNKIKRNKILKKKEKYNKKYMNKFGNDELDLYYGKDKENSLFGKFNDLGKKKKYKYYKDYEFAESDSQFENCKLISLLKK